jgi:hypothetical protein
MHYIGGAYRGYVGLHAEFAGLVSRRAGRYSAAQIGEICLALYRGMGRIHYDTIPVARGAITLNIPFQESTMSEQIFSGSCHCGAVKFEVTTPLSPAGRCNCSLCRRKGALMTPFFSEENLRILAGEDALTLYQFNSGVAKHYFCKHCGIYPFHQTRKDRKLWRANIGCLDNVDPYALPADVADGASLSVGEPK